MSEQLRKVDISKVDTKEFELPETNYVHDIDNRVFQGIVLQCLADIEGITLVEGNIIDNILGRSGAESVKGITAEQDSPNHAVNIRVEINICFGISIPEKAEEIQQKITEEITKLTGLHVGSIHVVFRNVVPADAKKMIKSLQSPLNAPMAAPTSIEEEYSDEF
jgi:uncharacterized alkaline shock family protein YloU